MYNSNWSGVYWAFGPIIVLSQEAEHEDDEDEDIMALKPLEKDEGYAKPKKGKAKADASESEPDMDPVSSWAFFSVFWSSQTSNNLELWSVNRWQKDCHSDFVILTYSCWRWLAGEGPAGSVFDLIPLLFCFSAFPQNIRWKFLGSAGKGWGKYDFYGGEDGDDSEGASDEDRTFEEAKKLEERHVKQMIEAFGHTFIVCCAYDLLTLPVLVYSHI